MNQDLILYVHVPFCSSKCHFCSWVAPIAVTDLVKSKARFSAYTAAVLSEIRATAARLKSRDIRPKLIYFGGGTPSLLPANELASLIRELHAQFPGAADDMDATIEMSPDTVTSERALILREAGFNRISFGVQSFNADRARTLGRAHTPLMAIEAFERARRAGFENINIDLMIGLPEETEQEFVENVETALMLEPDHISVYTYKQVHGTVLSNMLDAGRLKECPQAIAIKRYERSCEMLQSAGYTEYMFQLFSKGGKRCLVDFHYFNLDADYLGFGQGAHTLVGQKHYLHSQTLSEYLSKPAHNRSTLIADEEQALITRLYEMLHFETGLNYARFAHRLGITVDGAAQRYPLFRMALASALETGATEETESGIRFATREARLQWLTKPPYWKQDYKPDYALPALLPILAS